MMILLIRATVCALSSFALVAHASPVDGSVPHNVAAFTNFLGRSPSAAATPDNATAPSIPAMNQDYKAAKRHTTGEINPEPAANAQVSRLATRSDGKTWDLTVPAGDGGCPVLIQLVQGTCPTTPVQAYTSIAGTVADSHWQDIENDLKTASPAALLAALKTGTTSLGNGFTAGLTPLFSFPPQAPPRTPSSTYNLFGAFDLGTTNMNVQIFGYDGLQSAAYSIQRQNVAYNPWAEEVTDEKALATAIFVFLGQVLSSITALISADPPPTMTNTDAGVLWMTIQFMRDAYNLAIETLKSLPFDLALTPGGPVNGYSLTSNNDTKTALNSLFAGSVSSYDYRYFTADLMASYIADPSTPFCGR